MSVAPFAFKVVNSPLCHLLTNASLTQR